MHVGVQLAAVDRDTIEKGGRLEKIVQFMKPMADQALEYFSRCNEIIYDVEEDPQWKCFDLSKPEHWDQVSFKIRAYAYSNVGKGAAFHVNFGNKSFTHIADTDPVSYTHLTLPTTILV